MTTRSLACAAALAGLSTLAGSAGAAARETETSVVPAGVYRPLFPTSPAQAELPVAAFRLDRTPVTNGQYLAFVRAHPEWRRDRVQRALAEATYLGGWSSAETLGPNAEADQPVVDVSWFSARAYCATRGMRLPTEAEWERAAGASRDRADGSDEATWRAELLAMYLRPNPPTMPRVGTSSPNFFGIYDLHGLVWEWVLDFSSAGAALAGASDQLRFCGAGSVGAQDARDFPAFERVAFRSSLRASYTVKNLGFRCAGSAP